MTTLRLNAVFGRRVRRRRLELGLTQYDVAKLLRVARPNVAMVETGKVGATLSGLVKLCRVLKTTPNRLLKGLR